MSCLSTRLTTARFAQRLSTPDDFVLYLLLGRWRAAVVRVLVWSFVLCKTLFKILYYRIALAYLCVQFVDVTVKRAYSIVLRIDGSLHRPQLIVHAFQHICYVRNCLFHRYKGTEKV